MFGSSVIQHSTGSLELTLDILDPPLSQVLLDSWLVMLDPLLI